LYSQGSSSHRLIVVGPTPTTPRDSEHLGSNPHQQQCDRCDFSRRGRRPFQERRRLMSDNPSLIRFKMPSKIENKLWKCACLAVLCVTHILPDRHCRRQSNYVSRIRAARRFSSSAGRSASRTRVHGPSIILSCREPRPDVDAHTSKALRITEH
jgi:hypothetical protein